MKAMGKVVSYLKRPFINYAVEARAEKFLEKSKTGVPHAHPLYPTEERALRETRVLHPELESEVKKKHEGLDANLKLLKVSSEAMLTPGERTQPIQHLQSSLEKLLLTGGNKINRVDDYGLPDPPADRIQKGKLSFRQAVEVLQKCKQEDGNSGSIDAAIKYGCEELKLDEIQLRTMLTFVQPFATSSAYDRLPIRERHELPDGTGSYTTEIGKMNAKYIANKQRELESLQKAEKLKKNTNALPPVKKATSEKKP